MLGKVKINGIVLVWGDVGVNSSFLVWVWCIKLEYLVKLMVD